MRGTSSPKRIIGIDPGYDKFGIAVLEREDSPSADGEKVIYSDCFRTSAKLPFEDRLLAIGEELLRVIKKYQPEILAVEKLFFATNQKTAMGVSEIKGMTTFIAKSNGLQMMEFTPLQVKSAIAGYGKADKRQVADMVDLILRGKWIRKPAQGWPASGGKASKTEDDEYDAVAIALTCSACVRN